MLKLIKLLRLFRKVCYDDCTYIGLSSHKAYLRSNTGILIIVAANETHDE